MYKRVSRSALASAVLLAGLSLGCEPKNATISADSPELAAFVQLILPRSIEIQKHWTKAHSLDESGEPNGVEVILATKDSVGDSVKSVGTFTFELYTRRMASGDKYGERIGLWRMTVDSEEKLRQYWNRITRFYRFPLQLEQGTLPPGTYILKAQLIGPTGEKMFDEYEFENESGSKPTKHAGPSTEKENKPKSGTSRPKKK